MGNKKFRIGLLNIIAFVIVIMFAIVALTGCGEIDQTTYVAQQQSSEEPVKLSFMAEFYDNEGLNWLNVEGSEFDIKPNKVKQYGYSSDGTWTYNYELSSIMTVYIDNKWIETCGSTILFYDTRLEKLDIELPKEVDLTDSQDEVSISVPRDLRGQEYWTLNWWWDTKNLENRHHGKRMVIIQSQLGDPICMFSGDKVRWDIPKNLPKTTEICIDGKMLYIHRANFAIVDMEVFE